jgi:AraC-like DNA-binding protein
MTYTYISRIPAPPLSAYIDDIYYWDGPPPYPRLKVVPIPALHLMVNLGDAFQVFEPDKNKPSAICSESWAVGIWNVYHTVVWPTQVKFYGVHFKASGLYPFLGFPLSEMFNQVVSLDAIWGSFAAEIRERLYAASSVQAGLALFEQLLLTKLYEAAPYGLNVVQYAVTEIAQRHGTLSIRELSDHIGISQNHLGTQFKRMVGIPPKELARLYRFAHIHRSISPLQAVDWVDIALQTGYYDQSHFNKDFTAFVGHSPTDYLRLLRQLYATDPDHNHILRPIPTD